MPTKRDMLVRKLYGLAPEYRTNASSVPEVAELCKNLWVRGEMLRQAGKMFSYETTNQWEEAAIDAIEVDDKLIVAAGDIFPFGGIYGTYANNPFGYVEGGVNQILSPHTYRGGSACNINAGGTEITFLQQTEADTWRMNPLRYARAGCKFRIGTGGWVRIVSIDLTSGAPSTIKATILTTDITGAAHGYDGLTNQSYQLTWMPTWGTGSKLDYAGEFVQMYGDYIVFVNNQIPMSVWDKKTGIHPIRYGDWQVTSTSGYQGTAPHFGWLQTLNGVAGNQYLALDSYVDGVIPTTYGNYGYGYGCYHADGVNILRGANSACNFMEYLLLGGTNEVLQPITTTKPTGADPEPYCHCAGTTAVTFGTAGSWNVTDYQIKPGDIFVAPERWDTAVAKRLHWPDYSGGVAKGGKFHTIVSATSNTDFVLDSAHAGNGTDHMPFAILRKIGGNYVRWCNSKDSGGFTDWNASGDYDGNYREMGWGKGEILDIKRFGGNAWSFKEEGIGRVSYRGDYAVFNLDFVTDKIGTMGGYNSVIETPQGLLFPHGDDYYMFDGSAASLTQPIATGHRRIFGGWGNYASLTRHTGDYDSYHKRVVIGKAYNLVGGSQVYYGLMLDPETQSWSEATFSASLGVYDLPTNITMVRCPTAGLTPGATAGNFATNQPYTVVASGTSTKAFTIYDYDPTAHATSTGVNTWCKLPLDYARWTSTTFDMGLPAYVKQLSYFKMLEEWANSTTTPTFTWRVYESADVCGTTTDKYSADQTASKNIQVSANRFQVQLNGDVGTVVGNTEFDTTNTYQLVANTKIGQVFTTGTGGCVVKGIAVYCKYYSTATAVLDCGIYPLSSGGIPDAQNPLNSAAIEFATLDKNYRWHYVELATPITLAASTSYCIALRARTADVAIISTTPTTGGMIGAIADATAAAPYVASPYGAAAVSDATRKPSVFLQSAGNERGAGIGGLFLQWQASDAPKTESRT